MTLLVNHPDISENDYQKIIVDWNKTERDYPNNKTVIQLFEEQVAQTPHNIALTYHDQTITYQALNQASNQLARQIQQHYTSHQHHITPDTLIALLLDRSFEMFIGMLAILKTGAAYVPIDSSTPPDRLRFMLEDTDTKLLLTQQQKVDTLLQIIPQKTQLLALDTLDYQSAEKNNLTVAISPTSLAYVIYTSGTTGQPKGVMISHRNIINYGANVSHYFDDCDNIDFSTSIAFDLSVTTTLIPLLCGKKIVIYPGNLREIENYLAHLQQNNIHFIKSTPSFLTQAFSLPQSTKIKVCFVGGEKLLSSQLDCLLMHCDAVYDEYGPTENTVGTLLIQKTNASPNNGLIGKPYFNHKVYVLDKNQQPVAIGIVGELYVGGAGLARGYLNRPTLTAERFTPNPFTKSSEKMYKTGDLVRWLPDGNLEYIGRNDFQVKINGYRIELSEIEQALSSYSTILQSVVLTRENTVIAFYLSEEAVNEDVLISHLKRWLPEYMLPHHFVHMSAFPLTSNGKVDRQTLLQQEISSNNKLYIAPRTALEKQLCDVWQTVLGIEKIGILDDFFKVGGDSIKCMQVMASLLREGIDCRVRDIYTHRCIAQLSSVLKKNRVINAESGVLSGDSDLLPVQSWFFEQQFESINHWNQSFLVRVPPLSIDRLNAILPALIDHHDALRVCFQNNLDGSKRQVYGVKNCALKIKEGVQSKNTLFSEWQASFDIENGPLWQIGYVTGYTDGSARLYFAFHHLIIDTVSWRLLIDDIKKLYDGNTLGPKGSSYRQWANAIHQYTKKYPKEYLFWQNQKSEESLPIPLSTTVYYASLTLPVTITQQLIGPANKAYHTEINDLLLTALGLALSSYFGKSAHQITLEGHGREELDDTLDISRTLGWFTSMYPVLLTTQKDIATSIQFLKEYLRSIPNKGIGYGAFKYARHLNHALSDLPKIAFNYLGQFDSNSGYWQVVRESAGETVHPNNKRPHIFDITGSVIDGSLHVVLSSYLSQEACTTFSLLFEKQLIEITHHCLSVVNNENTLWTPSDFPLSKISYSLLNKLQQKNNAIEAIYPANSLQQGFIYHAISQPENDAYRVQLLLDYYNPLTIETYKNAWKTAIAVNPILRTYFNWDEGLLQIVNKEGQLNFQLHDLTGVHDKEKALSEIQIQDRTIPFDLTKPTLMRLHLIQFDQSHFVLLQNIHHSILDGWSLSLLLNQVHRYYDDLLQRKNPEIIPDTTYLQAQNYIANHQNEAADFWNEKLQKIQVINNINALLSHPTNLDTVKTLQKPKQSSIHITSNDFNALKQCVKKTGLTQNTLVQFAWQKLIQLYTGDTQTIVGTTLSGRSIPISGIDKSIGLYINTLPLIISWDNTHTLLQQLQIIESQLLELNDYCFVELASLHKNGQHLFHSLIIAEYDDTFDTANELTFHSRGTIETLNYPLALIVKETQNELTIRLKYDETYLSKQKAEQILLQLQHILLQIPNKLNVPQHEITFLTTLDYQKIIYDWNNTLTPYAHDKTIHQLFEEQVLKTPDAIALVFNHAQLTYKALNDAANQLAHFIAKKSATLTPICFDHSFEMVISILAVLKIGAAYVPIDPSYPTSRIKAILNDINSTYLLTSSDLVDALKNTATDIIAVTKTLYADQKTNNLCSGSKAKDLAYIIYTSGTTGLPKGVMISHQNVSNYLFSITQNEAYQKGSVVDCSSSIAFDATVAVLLAPLVSGRRVALCSPNTKRDTHLYLSHIEDNGIDLIRMTPSFLSALLATHDSKQLSKAFSNSVCLILGGEKTNAADINTWMTLFPNCRVINHYGPTETTVACSMFTIRDLNHAKTLTEIPLGKAAYNHQFYVLDQFLNPVPIGVVGELYVGGAGVAQGYFNQPELTEERFISNPFDNNGRLYKTGDLVRYLPDGHLIFIGRSDFQVKIRGYRVELSEIEQALLKYKDIQQCAVIVFDEKIAAYYVSKITIDTLTLKNTIENFLPNYMVPSVFVKLDFIPLTINGKLDRKALPKPIWADETTDYTAPRDELESLLCTLWQDTLGIEKIGIHDDFFRLGGHSILAVHLSHRMSQTTNHDVSVSDIFNYKTIAKLSVVLRSGNALMEIEPLAENTAPLSFAQERLWFIEQYEGGTDAYHIPHVFQLDTTINIDALKQALQAIVMRHEVLRTVFIQNEQGIYQQVIKDHPITIIQHYCHSEEFLLARQTFLEKPFDLTTDYPIRICLFYLNEDNPHLMLVFHHTAFDAWSKNIFLCELLHFYNAILHGHQASLPALTIQYNDFSIWQRNVINQRIDSLLLFWQKQLSGYELLAFPTDYPRPQKIDYSGDAIYFQLSKEHSGALKSFAKSQGITLYTLLLTGFAITVAKYCGQSDLMIGTPTANRQHTQLSKLIGFFVNLLPLRIQLNTSHTLLQSLHTIHTYLIEAQCHQDIPFTTLIEHLNVTRETSRHPLFQILFNLDYGDIEDNAGLPWKPMPGESDYRRSKLDLSVSLQDRNDGLFATVQYATSLFKKESIARFAAHYEKLLIEMIESINQPIHTYSLLSAAEYQQILFDWNATDHYYPKEKTLHQLFEEQVLKTPEKIAVVYEEMTLTYHALNEKANQLARIIRAHYGDHLNSDTMIAFCLNRSCDMIISLFAILKAGAAYVPIEPNSPVDRIRYILEDAKCVLLLTHTDCISIVKEACPTDTQLLVLDQCHYQHEIKNNLPSYARPCDLAYVIYTSGTTGLPKGVMVMHQGVVNIVYHIPKKLFLTEDSKVLQFASIAFDAAALQIFNPLTIGATLFIAPEAMRKNVDALSNFLKQHKITYAGLPPVLLAHLNPNDYPDLATLVVAGEAANEVQMKRWRPGRYLINAYGPTENTIGVSLHQYELNDQYTNIGRPLNNVKAYVLDQQLMPVPVGIAGELYVGGAGVARGYLNQPKLTQERFIPNPFENSTRLYKTGDLVRWLPSGELEFIGRNDFQVKIRGYRIELNEIEQVILKYNAIQQCVVIVHEEKIVAYYSSHLKIAANLLKNHVENYLPHYMVPNTFMSLDAFPLTSNGKLDRKSLPAPIWIDDTAHYAAPRDELESLLCKLWKDSLTVEKVGIHDDFFRLGGHSILAVHLSHRMSQATDRHVAVADIFKYKTIAELSSVMRTGDSLTTITPITENNSPLSFAQERLWFIEQYEGGTDAYHIPLILKLNNAINSDALKQALQAIVQRHEVLRTVFVQDKNGVYQQQVKNEALNIIEKNVAEEILPLERQAFFQKPFNLTVDYPIRLCLFNVIENNTVYLLIAFHHIAFDTWSKNIFMVELNYFYQEIIGVNQTPLPSLNIQYNDFANWQRNVITQQFDTLINYWKNKLNGYEPLDFPSDHGRPAMMDYRGDVVRIELSKDLLRKLNVLATHNHATLFTILLTGFTLLLSKYTGQTDLLIGTPVVNREHPLLDNLIGLFVNSLVLRIQIKNTATLEETIQSIQKDLIETQSHQDLPFEQLVNGLNLVRDTSRHPLFQIMFTVQHADLDEKQNELWTPVIVSGLSESAKFDLATSIQITKNNAKISIQYAKALFEKETIIRFADHYNTILNTMVDAENKAIQSYSLLNSNDYQQIMHHWNLTQSNYPKSKTIHALFEEQVKKTPNNIAVVFENKSLTYKELHEKSNQLAHYIYALSQNTLIALCVDRSINLIIGILGILKSGAAYVPIDPSYPKDRIDYIIKDTDCQYILTEQKLAYLFDNTNASNLLFLDNKPYKKNANTVLSTTCTSEDLAYVMYTSGTTGFPKGVMIEHRSVNCLIHSRLCDGIDDRTKGALWTNSVFDVSVYEIFSILLRGGELHIIPEEIRLDDKKLFSFLLEKKIASLYLPPFLVEKISKALLQTEDAVSLRKILLGVEPIPVQHLTGFMSKNISIINAYGPTEATVSSTAYLVEEITKIPGKIIPIGSPLNNESVYVLDSNLLPVPIGVVGELYIGGDGLARGYWKKEDLTNTCFIKTSFAKRLYKTGDLVKWLADGNLEYCGRRDFQVKINGMRIELSEIEQTLMSYAGIEQSVVITHEKMLITYYTGQYIDNALLSNYLSIKLPNHMVPSTFIHIQNLPLNTNGKLNRNALPLPAIQLNDNRYVPPRNVLDEKICAIWQDILNNATIGITDDFFALGGDSITSLQMISKLRYAEIHCTIKDIFNCRTISRLTDHILQQSTAITLNAEQGILEGEFDLLPIQNWFFEQEFPLQNHWNQAFFVRVPPLSFERLESILSQLIKHHDSLRIQFIEQNDHSWKQCYKSSIKNFNLKKLANDENLLKNLTILQTGLNIKSGPLWQLAYIDNYTDGSARLFFVAHHLIIDTVSWRIIIDDLKRLYEGNHLSAKTSSYREWQYTLKNYADTHQNEIYFWLTQIDKTSINLPREKHSAESLIIDEELTAQLLKEANNAYHTKTEELLLTALAYALSAITHQNACAVTLEGHGRETIDSSIDISQTVGWFTSLYPVMLKQENNLSETICHIKDHLRDIPNKGIGFSTLLGTKNLPKIYFNYFGQSNVSSENWSLISENTGTSIHPDNRYDFLILMNAYIVDGKLTIHSGFTIDSENKNVFLNSFRLALITIVDHCLYQIKNQQSQYTPGDFKAVHTEADLAHLPLQHNAATHYDPFEMTSIQKAYAIGRLKQFEIGNVANHVYAEFNFAKLNVIKLEKALNKIIAAYPEIRTVFDIGNLMQRYLPFDDSLHYQITVNEFLFAYNEEALLNIRNQLTHFVYDVSSYPLFHFRVSHFYDRDVLHMSFDLLLLDAQARMKFFTELTHLYHQENYCLPKRTINFRDYQVYMGMIKSSPWYFSDKAYWKEKLQRMPLRPKLLLMCDPRSIENPHFKLSKRTIAAPIWKKFKKNADHYGVSYASVLLSLYGFVLSRFSESSDFLITMTLFNRYGIHKEVNNLWGDFTSTNLFGFSRKDGSANNFFKATHDQLWDDIAHALYTGLDVQRDLMVLHGLEPTMAVSPIVFTCVVGETKNRTDALPYFISDNELIDKRYWIGQTSQAWIDLQATERDGCFSSGWLYVSQLFPDGFIEALNNAYCNLIEYLAENYWDKPLPDFALPTEHLSIISAANNIYQKMPSYTLVSLFENQANKNPKATAVIDSNGSYDYQHIQQKSHLLAYQLPIGKNQLIAVLCEKGFNQVVATLGIMSIGAAYLPLNVEWPLGRINDILIEGNVSHLLVSEMQWEIIKDSTLIHDYHVHRIEILTANENTKKYTNIAIDPNDPAYVIFTSGSTGKPKGVCISHAGAVNTILSVNKQFNINQNDVVLALSELSFDLSVYDLFGVLGAGGIVVFPDQHLMKEPMHWAALIKKHKITLWNSVPQLMQLLLDNAGNTISNLRAVLLSGDWVPLSLVSQVKALPSQPAVFSLGGATEASIWSIWYEISDTTRLNTIPYGIPMPNQNVYVLNSFGEHCPLGVAGEIHLGGDGLALEYWRDSDKTKQRFIQHETLGRLYKTGDLGKWHAAGYVEFLGRQDNQIKRNGNRVELDEIAAKLTQLKGIDNALVRMHEDRLIAYLVSTDFKSKRPDGFNIEQFKLAQHGLRTNLTNTYFFNSYQFDEIAYRSQKSYRQFSPDKIPSDIILIPTQENKNTSVNTIKNPDDLAVLLSVLSARQLSDKVLPKYLYPSAGSSYAIQCIVHIPDELETMQAGCYYYHPVLHTLQRIDDHPINAGFSIELSACQYAIETLYGKDWRKMAYLECGHMLYLLTHLLDEKNIAYTLKINEIQTNQLATLFLNADVFQNAFTDTVNTVVLHQQNTGVFKYDDQSFNLNDQTIFMQTSEAGHILRSAQALVIFEGENNPASWIQAGYEAQRHMNYWKTHKLGFCPLGLRPIDNTIYTIALGVMRDEDALSAETHAAGPSFSDALSKALSQHLPCYMLPQVFITLESLPLTSNGKIDFKALPLPDFSEQNQNYIAPRTALEKTLCEVWEEVLGISPISMTDDFFRIGGDSILSIHVTTKLRQLNIECEVLSIFEYRSIERLAPHLKINDENDSVINETQIDLSDLDLSNELLEKLQSRYEKIL